MHIYIYKCTHVKHFNHARTSPMQTCISLQVGPLWIIYESFIDMIKKYMNTIYTSCKAWLYASFFWPQRSILAPRHVRCWRHAGSFECSKLWSNWSPKVNISKDDGKATRSNGWLKWFSKVKIFNEFGSFTPSKLTLYQLPKVKVIRFGNTNPCNDWLK